MVWQRPWFKSIFSHILLLIPLTLLLFWLQRVVMEPCLSLTLASQKTPELPMALPGLHNIIDKWDETYAFRPPVILTTDYFSHPGYYKALPEACCRAWRGFLCIRLDFGNNRGRSGWSLVSGAVLIMGG